MRCHSLRFRDRDRSGGFAVLRDYSEVGFWSITLLARSCCGTCPRRWFRANFALAGHRSSF